MNVLDAFSIFRLLKIKGVGTAKLHSIINNLNKFDSVNNLLDHYINPSLNNSSELDYKEWRRLQDMKVDVVTLWDESYPARLKKVLGAKAPALLFVMGNIEILQKKSAGFCGSRKVSEKGLKTTQDFAEQLVDQEVNLVSGYAAGVDMTTHQTALENGGTTTIVLPEGIFHFRIKHKLKNVWDWERVVVVSEFLPTRPWTVGNAMQRNATICALSSAVILIEAKSSGGSMETGKKCLNLKVPVFAPVYEGMPEEASGNRILLSKGALGLKKSKSRGRANVNPLLPFIRSEARNSTIESAESGQKELFVS